MVFVMGGHVGCELKNGVMGAFLNGADACGWLKHVKAILDAAQDIAM